MENLPSQTQTPRINGAISTGGGLNRPSASYGTPQADLSPGGGGSGTAQGDITLNFANTDIRTVIDQILGSILDQNYTIDPGVQGSVSMRTVAPISRDQLIPTLQTLLAQNNAVLVRTNGLYRVMPADQAAATPNLSSDAALGGSVVIPLRFTQAAPLAAALQPYVSSTGRIIPAADQNALIVQGDPSSRQALVDLIEAFDVDTLAGQSYELFPVPGGDASDFASAFTAALGKSTDPSQPGPVRVVPLEHINAVLIIARNQPLLNQAQRVYAVLAQAQRNSVRNWYIYYLHYARSNDAAYVLQEAFTPDNVTAQPTPPSTGQPSNTFNNQNNSSSNSPTGNGQDQTTSGNLISSASGGASSQGTNAAPAQNNAADQNGTAGAAALLGPLSATGGSVSTDALRILPDNAHNSLMVYATAAENDRIQSMLYKIDISPVQVMIDATIAEVDLDSALQYGTQYFFKFGGINAVLSESTTAALATNFPGFVLSGHGSDAAPLAISLLQSVTHVNVLSSPQLMVLDGQSATLQSGAVVPYLSQTSQSTLTSNAPIVNSINYRNTGIILQITPHIGDDGLVTLDISQEVSAVQPNVTTPGLNSPTFSDQSVTSRIAIQDGETVGLAGLISDTDSHMNRGIPFLKNIPVLGALVSTQNNSRTRTELLVLITPHVIRTQSDAAGLTADLREELPNASSINGSLSAQPLSYQSADPTENLRAKIPQ